MRLEAVERVEEPRHARDGVRARDEPQLVGRDDREQAEADGRDVRVVADARLARAEPDVVDGQDVLAVGERLEPAPGVAREPRDERLVGRGQRVPVDEQGRRPAGEPRADVRPRRLLAAVRRLPRLLPYRHDDGRAPPARPGPRRPPHRARTARARGRGRRRRASATRTLQPRRRARARRARPDAWPPPLRRRTGLGKAISRAGSGRCSRRGASPGSPGGSPRPGRTCRPATISVTMGRFHLPRRSDLVLHRLGDLALLLARARRSPSGTACPTSLPWRLSVVGIVHAEEVAEQAPRS